MLLVMTWYITCHYDNSMCACTHAEYLPYSCTHLIQEEDLYQEAEPLVKSGIAAALQLASKKGFISTEKSKREAGESMRTTADAKRDL